VPLISQRVVPVGADTIALLAPAGPTAFSGYHVICTRWSVGQGSSHSAHFFLQLLRSSFGLALSRSCFRRGECAHSATMRGVRANVLVSHLNRVVPFVQLAQLPHIAQRLDRREFSLVSAAVYQRRVG
jgi:hypothetical protein